MKLTVDLTQNKGFRIKSGASVYLCEPPEGSAERRGAMNPAELFIASLGSSIATSAVTFCQERSLSPVGLKVGLDWEYASESNRIARISVSVRKPEAVDSAMEDDFMSSIHECDVYQTLQIKPDIHYHTSTVDEKPEGEILIHFVGAE
jgi:uncharacterized OsmC-like protein